MMKWMRKDTFPSEQETKDAIDTLAMIYAVWKKSDGRTKADEHLEGFADLIRSRSEKMLD